MRSFAKEKRPQSATPEQLMRETEWSREWKRNKIVYILFIPVAAYFLIFRYLPMFGVLMSFQDFDIGLGFFKSPWCGLDNFIELFTGDSFLPALRNTIILALFNLVLGFPAPIIFALLVTNVRCKPIRNLCQTISYMPNFVASVVVVALVQMFVGYDGPLTMLLTLFGLDQQNWLANATPPVFWLIYTLTSIWQSFGYGAIVYIAAIENVNKVYQEAAAIDGANRWQRVWKITVPNIMPMIVTMLILQIAISFNTGTDKILLMYMPQTYSVADTLYTYTYRMAFGSSPDFGLSAASGLFQSVVATILMLTTNAFSRKVSENSLF